MRNNPSFYWDISAYNGANGTEDRLTFYNTRNAVVIGFNGNGAILVNSGTGTAGQVLQTNGANSPASWASSTNALYNNTGMVTLVAPYIITANSSAEIIPGLTANFSTTGNARVLIQFNTQVIPHHCFACEDSGVYIDLMVDGSAVNRYTNTVKNATSFAVSGSHMVNVTAGNHAIQLRGNKIGPSPVTFGESSPYVTTIIYQVIPQ